MKKKLTSIITCLAILISLVSSLGFSAFAGEDPETTLSNLTLKLSKDGAAYDNALVTLVDEDGKIYFADNSGFDAGFSWYETEKALSEGIYDLYVNGYLTQEIEITAQAVISLEVPCYSVYAKLRETGAADGSILTASYVVGGKSILVPKNAVLPGGGELVLRAFPAGADSYTVKWTPASYGGTAAEDACGAYTYTIKVDQPLNLVCTVQGKYNTQTIDQAITRYYPDSNTTATKITNPAHGAGQADGLNTNEDVYTANRINSYAWSMASNTYTGATNSKLVNGQEYIYVGTNRNLYGGVFRTMQTALFNSLSATYDIDVDVLKATITKDQITEIFDYALDLYFNGDIPQVRTMFGNDFFLAMTDIVDNWVGQILRVDPSTDTTEVIYTTVNGSNYRSALVMNNNIYFGSALVTASASGNTNNVVKVDGEGNATCIFNNGSGTTNVTDFGLSLRAGDVYSAEFNQLIYAGVAGVIEDPQTGKLEIAGLSDAEKTLPVVFLMTDNGDGTVTNQVVCDIDGEGLPILKGVSGVSSTYSGGVWDICMYHGEPYMTVVKEDTFTVIHGKVAQPGEEDRANAYGWIWEVLYTMPYEDDHIAFSMGAQHVDFDTNSLDVTATMCVHNDKLYFGCFDNFANLYTKTVFATLTNLKDSDSGSYLTDTFLDLYKYLEHRPLVFVYDGETFTEDEAFAEMVAENNIDYLWRMIDVDSDLYVTTLDADIMHRYVMPLESNRVNRVLGALGIKFDFNYADLMDQIEVLKDQCSNCDKQNTIFAVREDAAAAFIANVMAAIAKYTNGEPIEIDPVEVLQNNHLILYVSKVAVVAERFINGKMDYAEMVEQIEALNKKYAKTGIEGVLTLGDVIDAIDLTGIFMVMRMNVMLDKNTDGFDLYKLDGETDEWSTVLDDGFGDRYNYGGRTMTVCRNDLYIGTANPFYGAQIWRIDLDVTEPEPIRPIPVNPTPTPSSDDTTKDEPEKEPEAEPQRQFIDVYEEDYYNDAVDWAVKTGITTGTSENEFSPNVPCTREQLVAFLWRAAGCPEPTTDELPFKDVASDSYAMKALLWAYENGIAKGTSATTFSPSVKISRAQAVAFLHRFSGELDTSAVDNPFGDVSGKDYYFSAVAWAIKNGITQGTSDNTFSPNNACTRAQIVTLLFRFLG